MCYVYGMVGAALVEPLPKLRLSVCAEEQQSATPSFRWPHQQARSFGWFFPLPALQKLKSVTNKPCVCVCVCTHHIVQFLLVNIGEGQGEHVVPPTPSPLGVLHHPV